MRVLIGAFACSVLTIGLAASSSPVDAVPSAAAAPLPVDALPFGFTDVAVASVSTPVAVRAMPDGSVTVLGKSGTVHVIRGGALVTPPALTLSGVCTQSERGLLGIAPDANFVSNGYVYLYYTHVDGSMPGGCANRVSRFTMSGDVIDPGSELVLVDKISSNAGNHNGGDVEIGKDGYLYIAVGDAGSDPRGGGSAGTNDAARDLSLLNGKVLRVDPATGNPAPGNPYSGAGTESCRVRGNTAATPTTTCQEIYASGLRNPWRFAFDPNASGVRFFINDVGQGTREEVDEGAIGADYGWNVREGQCPQGQSPPCAGPPAGMTDPITDYGRGVGTYITGGAFVPNGHWPSQYDGAYLFGDGGSGSIWVRTVAGTVDYGTPFHTADGLADMDFVLESGGLSLYYVVSSTGTDSVRKITFPTQVVPTPSDPLHFVSTTPAQRVFDSRRAADGAAPLTGNTARTVSTGVGGTTRAVLANITYVDPATDGFLTAWAGGAARPATSNINALAGEVVANAAVVPVDAQGNIQVLTNTTADVVIDVLGRFELAPGPVADGRFVPLTPERAIDTRDPSSTDNSYTETGAAPVNVVGTTVGGAHGVPSDGVSAVVLTVTALAGGDPRGGWVTVSPGGATRPEISNVNTNEAGDIRPNLVVVPLGASGAIDLHLFQTDDVVVDVTGYFTDDSAPATTSGRFRSVSPYRETDTRTPFGFDRFTAPGSRTLDPVVVPSGAIGVAHNVVIVNNAAAGFVTTYPDEPRPLASTANATGANQLRAASAFTRTGPAGTVRYYAMMPTDLVVDVTGWFEG